MDNLDNLSEKSHVSLEAKVCPVCGVKHNHDCGLLLETRIRGGELMKSLERETVTGWGLCEEHEKLRNDGYVALVECDPEKSSPEKDGNIKPENAWRTGKLAHIKEHAFRARYKQEPPEGMLVFVVTGVISELQGWMPQPTETEEPTEDEN